MFHGKNQRTNILYKETNKKSTLVYSHTPQNLALVHTHAIPRSDLSLRTRTHTHFSSCTFCSFYVWWKFWLGLLWQHYSGFQIKMGGACCALAWQESCI